MQFTASSLLYQLLTQCLPGFAHNWEALGPLLLDADLPDRGVQGAQSMLFVACQDSARRATAVPSDSSSTPCRSVECGEVAHHPVVQVIHEGAKRSFLPHAWGRFAGQDSHLHARVELSPCGGDPPALVVPRSQVGPPVDGPVKARRDQGARAGAAPRRADVVAPLSPHERT
jgi:hypothetical protein